MKTSTATGSLERFIRTVFQIAVADSAAFPALLAAFNISPTLAAKVIGIVNAIVLAVVAVQNALESKAVIPAMLRVAPPAASPLPALPEPQPVTASGAPILPPSVPAVPLAGGPVDPTPGSPTAGQVAS